MTGEAARIGVYGLGNVLMGDDAVGPFVVEMLRACYDFPAQVAVRDLGTPGLDLTPYIAGLDALILVDAVTSNGPVGSVRAWRREAILEKAPPPRLSPHDPGLTEALLIAQATGQCPREVLLVGIIAGQTGTGVGLSARVRTGVQWAMLAVLVELNRLGAAPRRRCPEAPPDIWWEVPPASHASPQT